MREYTPDNWVIVHIESEGTSVHKLLAGFHGGYTWGDSWKLNSGVTKIEDRDGAFFVHGYSGSVYKCWHGAERLSGFTGDVLAGFQRQLESVGTIEVVPIASVLEQYRG